MLLAVVLLAVALLAVALLAVALLAVVLLAVEPPALLSWLPLAELWHASSHHCRPRLQH